MTFTTAIVVVLTAADWALVICRAGGVVDCRTLEKQGVCPPKRAASHSRYSLGYTVVSDIWIVLGERVAITWGCFFLLLCCCCLGFLSFLFGWFLFWLVFVC